MDNNNIDLPKTKRARQAFTLIELLVVIAIMGIVAALIVNLSAKAAKTRKINRVRVELEQLDTVIESYKEKNGFYPPSNGDSNINNVNQLFYELTGTIVDEGSTEFTSLIIPETITAGKIDEVFKVGGFANSATTRNDVKNFYTTLKSTQYADMDATGDNVQVLIVPVEGPNDLIGQNEKELNTWRYNSTTPTHNPESFDLWAEIVIGGETITIGNWKD